jgi:hypothetical protein
MRNWEGTTAVESDEHGTFDTTDKYILWLK